MILNIPIYKNKPKCECQGSCGKDGWYCLTNYLYGAGAQGWNRYFFKGEE